MDIKAAAEKSFGPFQREHPLFFIGGLTVIASLGALLGGSLDWIISRIKRPTPWSPTCAATCFGVFVLQISISAALIYLANYLFSTAFYAWFRFTWSGILFAFTFFVGQSTLSRNINCVFNVYGG